MARYLRRVTAAALLGLALTACGKQPTLSTLSVENDTQVAEVFSLANALDLGVSYLGTLDFENAILQYTKIIDHDPMNKEAYAGLYAAYTALGQDEEADKVLEEAEEVFQEKDSILSELLKNGDLIFQSGGGDNLYRELSDWYLRNREDSVPDAIYRIGKSWLSLEPDEVEPYSLLGMYYVQRGEDAQAQELVDLAERNGIQLNEINTEIETKANGDYVIRMEIEMESQTVEIEVEAEPEESAQEVTRKITEEVAEDMGEKVLEDSGLEGPGAEIAQQMIDEALKQGLSAMSDGMTGGFGF